MRNTLCTLTIFEENILIISSIFIKLSIIRDCYLLSFVYLIWLVFLMFWGCCLISWTPISSNCLPRFNNGASCKCFFDCMASFSKAARMFESGFLRLWSCSLRYVTTKLVKYLKGRHLSKRAQDTQTFFSILLHPE